MNKQIEDMRGDLIEIFDKEYDERRLITPHNTAEKLTALGYRKASDVAREIFEEIIELVSQKAEEESEYFDRMRVKGKDGRYFEGGKHTCEMLLLELAELKKKYESEGEDDV